jgi:RNA polymerase primary sigma factor
MDNTTDILKIYLKEVNNYHRILTKQQEYEYILDYQNNNNYESRNVVITSHLKFVVGRAKKFADQTNTDIEDLINAGNEALLIAIEKFNTETGNRFLSYANWWILEKMQILLKELALIRLPHNKVVYLHKIKKAVNSHLNTTGHEPTPEDISKMTNLSEKEIEDCMSLTFGKVSLDDPINAHESDTTYYNLIPDRDSITTEDILYNKDLIEDIQRSLYGFEDREISIINDYYGLNKIKQLTLDEITIKYSITGTRVRQIVNKVIKKLRHPERSEDLKKYL